MTQISLRSYLIRAIYDWVAEECQHTAYITVAYDEETHVPVHYVKDGYITLNISAAAVTHLNIDTESMQFTAKFSGVEHYIFIPIGRIVSIFARESGEGMSFEPIPSASMSAKERLRHILLEDENAAELDALHDEERETTSAGADHPEGEPSSNGFTLLK